jgi:hypothetical protein
MDSCRRNPECHHYGECLTSAARENSPGWDCSGCARFRPVEVDLDTNFEAYILLLWAILLPERYQQFLEIQRRGL